MCAARGDLDFAGIPAAALGRDRDVRIPLFPRHDGPRRT
jgi:hypothetical protein